MANNNDIQEVLSQIEFSVCSISSELTPEQIKINAKKELEEIEKQRCLAIEAIMTFENIVDDVKRLHDYFALEIAKAESANRTQATKSTYYLEAWIPEG